MKITDNKVLIDYDLTPQVLDALTLFIADMDDISLEIKKSTISVLNFDIPLAVSSVSFEDCLFKKATIISGLQKGRTFKFIHCNKQFFLGNVKLKKIHCSVLVIKQTDNNNDPESNRYADSVCPDIEESQIDHLECKVVHPPFFSKVIFTGEIIVESSTEHESSNLSFDDCKFSNRAELKISIQSPLFINIRNCKNFDTDDSFIMMPVNFYNHLKIKHLGISNSQIGKINFHLFGATIENIEISDSSLKDLDCGTIKKEKDDSAHHDSIYNISITNSSLNKFSVRHRKIIHEIVLTNSTFKVPPQFFDANIPEGSEFPNQKHFLSRKGDHDASCYRALRFIMESQRNRELEGMFFSLEKESLLNNQSKIKKYLSISYFYFLLSDYGTNYRTPLLTLLVSIPIFTLIYSAINSNTISFSLPIDWDLIIKSFIITLKQTFLPFEILRNNDFLSAKPSTPAILTIFTGVINSLFSISLLALSALALRWKFKRG